MRDVAENADTPGDAARRGSVLVGKWRGGRPWTSAEAEEAEVLLKRLRRGDKPHASLLEALDANRDARDPLAGP